MWVFSFLYRMRLNFFFTREVIRTYVSIAWASLCFTREQLGGQPKSVLSVCVCVCPTPGSRQRLNRSWRSWVRSIGCVNTKTRFFIFPSRPFRVRKKRGTKTFEKIFGRFSDREWVEWIAHEVSYSEPQKFWKSNMAFHSYGVPKCQFRTFSSREFKFRRT